MAATESPLLSIKLEPSDGLAAMASPPSRSIESLVFNFNGKCNDITSKYQHPSPSSPVANTFRRNEVEFHGKASTESSVMVPEDLRMVKLKDSEQLPSSYRYQESGEECSAFSKVRENFEKGYRPERPLSPLNSNYISHVKYKQSSLVKPNISKDSSHSQSSFGFDESEDGDSTSPMNLSHHRLRRSKSPEKVDDHPSFSYNEPYSSSEDQSFSPRRSAVNSPSESCTETEKTFRPTSPSFKRDTTKLAFSIDRIMEPSPKKQRLLRV